MTQEIFVYCGLGGGTPSKSNHSFWEGGTIPWVTPKDMKVERIHDSQDHITEDAIDVSAAKLIPANSVAVVVRSGILRHTFPVAVLGTEATLNQDMKALVPYDGVSADYVAHALRSYGWDILKTCSKSGTTVSNINMSELMRYEIPLPPLAEQERIVAKIEELFPRLDKGVEALTAAKKQLARYRAAVLKAAFSGKLTEDWRKKHGDDGEACREFLTRIEEDLRQTKRRRLIKGKLGVGELPKLPNGWEWRTFEDVSERVTVGHVGSMKDEYVDCGVPFLRGQNVRATGFDRQGLKFISEEFHASLSKSALSPGDILTTRSGNVGISCVVPESLSVANCSDLVITKQPKGILPHYGAHYMNSIVQSRVASKRVGVALTHFNTKSMAAMPIPIAPPKEQARIVDEIERTFSLADAIEKAIDDGLKEAGRLRQGILKKAFEGRLVPQDPNDEPASELLKRIQAQREAEKPVKKTRKKYQKRSRSQ